MRNHAAVISCALNAGGGVDKQQQNLQHCRLFLPDNRSCYHCKSSQHFASAQDEAPTLWGAEETATL